MSDTRYLDQAYKVNSPETARSFYDDWAGTYDAEITENGYATPGRIAGALAGFTSDKTVPVLDFACGTGISGLKLSQAGFSVIDGVDISAEMLEGARGKAIYRALHQSQPGVPLPFAKGNYGIVAAVGAIGHGAAPLSIIDELLALLDPGGIFAVSFNDKTLMDPAYHARMKAEVSAGRARLLLQEHGDHLPGIGMGATIYVLEIV